MRHGPCLMRAAGSFCCHKEIFSGGEPIAYRESHAIPYSFRLSFSFIRSFAFCFGQAVALVFNNAMTSYPRLQVKIATQEWEFEAIHRLNYKTFVEEIPQHAARAAPRLVDKFHLENTYI